MILKCGYLFIYLSNESSQDVFFDQLVVHHRPGPLLAEDHYYPFGLEMVGISDRAMGRLENRYRYNGMELNEKEFTDGLGLDLYTAKFRGFDPQTGRWWQIDPKPTYDQSPYSAMQNDPIRFSDLLGDTIILAKGSSQQFIKDYHSARTALIKSGSGSFILSLEKSKATYTIKAANGLHGNEGSNFNPKTKTLSWNSREGLITTKGKVISAAVILNHEMDHMNRFDKDPKGQMKDFNTPVPGYGNKEEERVIKGSEQQTARNLGEIGKNEVTRTDHFGTMYKTMGPLSTELDVPPAIISNKKRKMMIAIRSIIFLQLLIIMNTCGFGQNSGLINCKSVTDIKIEYVDINIETPINVNCANFENYFGSQIRIKKIVKQHQICEFIDNINRLLKSGKKYSNAADVRIKIFIEKSSGATEIFCMGNLTSTLEGKNYINNKKFVSIILKYLN